MKKSKMSIAALVLILAIMTGCGQSKAAEAAGETQALTLQTEAGTETETILSETAFETAVETAAETESSVVTAIDVSADGLLDPADLFTDRDLVQTADLSEAVSLTVSDGEDITITEEGVYLISGTASDCTLIVAADSEAKVQLVLDGVTLTNSDAPAIYVKSADKVFITTTDSENTLTVSGTFTALPTSSLKSWRSAQSMSKRSSISSESKRVPLR